MRDSANFGVSARRFSAIGCWALTFCISAAAAPPLRADEPQQTPAAVRLISAKEGRKIAAAALDGEDLFSGAQDCSHLVHQIYSEAGYDYPYASSFDLYAGHGSFRRVRHPQAGDLITWPGHVGIVLDSAHHSFYSLVRSGLQAEDYLSPYWRSRGRARFYRYVAATGSEIRTAKVTRPAPPTESIPTGKSGRRTTEELAQAERANPNQAASEASLRSKVIAAPVAPDTDTTAEPLPSSIVITTEHRAPTPEEALDGISELGNMASGVLRTAEPLNVKIPVVVFDEIHVERIEIKRDKGWAHLQMDSHARIGTDGTDFKRRREKVRWELRHDASGWSAIAPADRAYVARDSAVRVLAAQLSEMTQSDAAAQHQENIIGQEARIANLLSALLQD